MGLWTKIRKSGKRAEKNFYISHNKHGQLCVKSNDFLYFFIHRRTPTYPLYKTKEYGFRVKEIARYFSRCFSKRQKLFLKTLVKNKASHLASFQGEFLLLKGIPDFLVYNSERKCIFFAEVKANKSKLSGEQKNIMKKLLKHKINTYIYCFLRESDFKWKIKLLEGTLF